MVEESIAVIHDDHHPQYHQSCMEEAQTTFVYPNPIPSVIVDATGLHVSALHGTHVRIARLAAGLEACAPPRQRQSPLEDNTCDHGH